MTIKVQCPCGTRFQFDVTPVNGRMPVRINCPTCNADDTGLANALIQQQLGAAEPSAIPVATLAPTPGAPAPSSGLRIAGSHHAQPAPPPTAAPPAQPPDESAAQLCPKHPTETAVDVCKVCGKPICLKCMEMFGYVCSVYCRQQATARRIYIPVYANQKSVVAGKSQAIARRITYAVVALLMLMLGLWIWYEWFARTPKVVYSISFPKLDPNNPRSFSRPNEFFELIGPGQLLSVRDKSVSLFDVEQQRQLWSTPLQKPSKAAADSQDSADSGDEGDFYFFGPHVVATSNDVWLAFAGGLSRFDLQTGAAKNTGIKDHIMNVTMHPDSILVITGEHGKRTGLASISLPDGTVQTEELTPASPKPVPAVQTSPLAKNAIGKGKASSTKTNQVQVPLAKIRNLAAQTQATPATAPDANAEPDNFDEFGFRDPFIAAGPNVVEMKTKLLEQKTVAHQAMKPKGKSIIDNPNLNASQGIEAAQEILNDLKRDQTGGVETEDVSTYQVTLHRYLQKGISDWTGEVTGPPQFFPLQTVDVLVAGQGIVVFDKQNKKLWEAKLTFPVVRHYLEDGESAPCIEMKDALYFADAGTLTRFDQTSGNVRWRYNTVGITRILADERGGVYIVTSTASPEQIQYSQQINLHDKVKPVVMKLDAATGKVKWRQESIGEELMWSGKFLYATRVSITYALLRLEEGPDTHYNLNLLDPSSGSVIWNYHQGNRHVLKTEPQKNWILVQMEDELVVLKFFSL